MDRSGISNRLIKFSNILLGRIRGGLAHVNVVTSTIFAGTTGVALAEVVALGTVFVPSMVREGYDKKFAAALTAASAILGPIIPPSIIIVLYCAVVQESVGALFVGAIIPGLMIGLSDVIIVWFRAKQRGYPKQEIHVTAKEYLIGFKDALLALFMPFIIIGGLVGGIFTPTEAAAAAVVYGLIIGFLIYRSLKIKDLLGALKNTVILSSKLFFILAGASMLTWIFGFERMPVLIDQVLRSATDNKYVLLLLVNLFFLFMGTWMDIGASIILFAPIVAPIAKSMGVDPIQFGIMVVVNNCIGLVTPPVGVVLFAISDLTKLDIMEVGRELMPFILINILVVMMVAYIPELTLFLPRLFGFTN
jgi:tripartite ATP-independent transporter DctM subunit